MAMAMNGTPRYAARAQNSACPASVVAYMNEKAVSQIEQAAASAANETVTRDTRRPSTIGPKTIISSDVTAVGRADGARPCWKTSNTTCAEPTLESVYCEGCGRALS